MADQTSPLRRSQAIAPYSDAEQSLLDNAFASPFTRSLQQAINTDVAGTYRQQALEAQVRGDAAGQRAAEYNRQSALRRMELPTVGPTTLDAAKETGNYGDYVQNVLGGMAGSMVKPLVGSSIGGLVGGLPGAAIGGFGGSFSAIRNAELENYANDEQLKTMSPAEQLRVTRNSAALQALPEAIMPAYLGAGGRLPGALNRVPTPLRVAGGVATEGGTEGLQDYTSQRVAQSQFPDREIDWNSVRENVIAGLVGGGAMSVLGRHDTGPEAAPVQEQGPAAAPPMDAAPPGTPLLPAPDDGSGGGGSGPADTMLGKVAGLGAAVQDRFGDDIAAAGGKAKDMAGKAKDFVSDTVDRMTEAVKTAENPGDFLNKVFGGNIDEEAAADMTGEPNPALKGITFEETEANIARDDAKKVARAARYADELLNDPATPDSIKQRVVDMQGDYANPENQSFVARTLVAQRGGEKITKAVQDLVDLGKSAFAEGSKAAGKGLSAAKKAAGDAATAAQDRIVKKNMQDVSPAEQAAFSKVIFDGLTDEAKASPLVRAQLAQVTNIVMAFAAKTGDITAKDLPTLTRLSNAMSLFKDPDAMAAQLVEYGAIPRDTDSFLGRVKAIQNARTDIKQPNSFLYTSLTPEAKDLLTGPMLQRLAQFVDEFSLQDAAGKGDQTLEGLTQAFGSKENAQAVLDFYAQQNKADLRFDPNEQVRDDAGEIDSDELSSWEGSINERDAGKAMFRFKDAKSMRPFFKGSKDIDNARRDGTLGDESTQTPYSYAEYVKETGKDPEAEVRRLFKIIDGLIAEHKKHKKEDRSAMINPLLGERSMLEAAYKEGGVEEALSLYEVLRTEAKDQNDLVATDEDLAKYAFKKGASRVTFKRTDGTKLMLSAESMWKTFGDNQKGAERGGKEGDTARARRLFKEAVTSVLARPDIESLETSLSGLKLDEKGTEVEPKIDPVLREKIAHDLNKASGSLSEIKAGLQRLFKGYSAALSQGNLGKQAVYTFEDQLRTRIGQAAKAVESATTAPQRAVLRERHLLYERALERVLEIKQDFLDDGVGGNGNTDEADTDGISRLRKEMDTSEGERRVEEDTGAEIESGTRARGAPKTGTGSALGTVVKRLQEPLKSTVARSMSAEEIEKEIAAVDKSIETLKAASLEDFRALAASKDDLSFEEYMNIGAPAMAKKKADMIESAEGLKERWESHLKRAKSSEAGGKAKKNPAASSRETAKKVNDSQALSPDAFTALHDVAVKENYSRLDTPAKVLKFAAMAAKAREQLKKIPELERTDTQDELRYQLNDMFNQNKGAAFDWESLWDGLDPTDAQKAQLESIVRPKAEPGTARQSEGRVRKNSFIGAKADPEGEGDAADLLGVGVPADFVWRELGWFRGPDGKLRKEVRSPVLRQRVRALAKAIAAGSREATTIRDLIEGIPQFENYLDTLGDLRVDPADDVVEAIGAIGAFSDGQGYMGPGIGLSRMHAETEARISAFRNGEGLKKLKEVAGRIADQQMASLGYIELEMEQVFAELEKEHPMPDIEDRVADILADTVVHELQHAFQYVEGFENGGTAATAVVATYGDVEGYIAAMKNGDSATAESIAEQAFEQLRVEVGPDGDVEAKAHELYESIAGEVEANDVAARMKLSDEEAANVKPALMDAERRFVRSLLLTEALHTVRGMGKRQQGAKKNAQRASTMDPIRGKATSVLTKDEQQKIIDEVVRIRGKDVKVAFGKFADIGGSGEFSMNADKTERLIRIAISSLNPMSVAWHESLHDFMAMLGGSKAERKLKADLLAAAEAPQVVTKLRELLKGHPKALEQIESDREERLAYMYQFWAEGLLTLGPTGSNIFSRAARFFREMLGVLSQDEKIEQLLTALHTGKFSEPSLVAAVLEDLKAQTLGDKARAVAGPIGDAAEAMFTGATDRLRDTNIDALTELADMFHREPGREKTGELPFLQRRAQQVGKRLNKLQDILKDTTSEERRRALENMQAMKPASTPLEKELAAYLKEMRDYMVDRGVKRFDTKLKKWVDLGDVKDYFPRVWDKEIIRNNEAEFIALLEQYVGKAQARESFNALVNGDGSLELAENEHHLGFTPWNPAVLDRRFTFINPSNAEAFAKFQSKDMADIMTSYTQRAVHRAEYAHSFGNNGEVITQKFLDAQKQGATQDELDMARKATMAMEGTLGYEFNPRLKEVMSGIVTYQNIVLLPLSLFSNLIDPLGVAMRSNDMKEAWKAFTYGIKGIADQIRGAGDDAQTEMARTLGLIDEQNMLEAMGHVYNSMHMSRFLKNINSKFFRYNGMEMWNQRMRVAAMMAAQRFILSHAGGGAPKISYSGIKNDSSGRENHSKRYLEELGITEKDVFQLQDGTIALTKDQLLQAGAKKEDVLDIEKRIQAAVFKWVDGAVLRPNAAHRPIWGSDPRYQLIFHLKQFTFSFQNTILRRVGEELKHGNVAPGWILMSYVPFMFLSDVMKGSLTGTLNTSADLYDVASQSIARSGITGTGVFGADAMGDLERGKLPGTSFLGPAFGHLMTLLSGITGHAGVEQVMDRSVPFAKYI